MKPGFQICLAGLAVGLLPDLSLASDRVSDAPQVSQAGLIPA
jgi:hypothetical protein